MEYKKSTESTLQQHIGVAIRNERKAQALTLQSLAQKVGADAGNLSRIERGA